MNCKWYTVYWGLGSSVLLCKFDDTQAGSTTADRFWTVWAAEVDQPGNPPFFFPLWNSISQGPRVVSLRAISSAALTLSSAASQLLSLPGSLLPSSRTHPFPPSLLLPQPLHLCVQGSSEACSWLRPPLLWAKDAAGGQGSGSSLKKSRQIKDKKYWGRKK